MEYSPLHEAAGSRCRRIRTGVIILLITILIGTIAGISPLSLKNISIHGEDTFSSPHFTLDVCSSKTGFTPGKVLLFLPSLAIMAFTLHVTSFMSDRTFLYCCILARTIHRPPAS